MGSFYAFALAGAHHFPNLSSTTLLSPHPQVALRLAGPSDYHPSTVPWHSVGVAHAPGPSPSQTSAVYWWANWAVSELGPGLGLELVTVLVAELMTELVAELMAELVAELMAELVAALVTALVTELLTGFSYTAELRARQSCH